ELVRTDPCGDTLDADLRIDRGEALAGGVYLGPSDVGGAEQDLTLQIGQIDLVGVDQGQRPDAGGSEKVGGRVTQAADADDQRMRVGKALLRVDTQLGQQHVPAVTEQLRVVHRRFRCLLVRSKNARTNRAFCAAKSRRLLRRYRGGDRLGRGDDRKTLQAVQRLLQLKVIGRTEFQTRLRRFRLLRVFLRLFDRRLDRQRRRALGTGDRRLAV